MAGKVMESRIERYYYLKDTQGNYLGCVCIYRDPDRGTFSRGISLCNTKLDHFIKKRARGIAYARALIANSRYDLFNQCKESSISTYGPEVKAKAWKILCKYDLSIIVDNVVQLCQPRVSLTDYELRMWDDVLNPDNPNFKSLRSI